MNIKEFAYLQKSEKKESETVDLVCDTCGEKVTRPVFIKLTGHLHDQKCTYICTICRGAMREVKSNPVGFKFSESIKILNEEK